MALVLTWFVQSLVLALLAAGVTSLPPFRSRASARSLVWTLALSAVVLLVLVALLEVPAPAGSRPFVSSSMPADSAALAPLALPVPPAWMVMLGVVAWCAGAMTWGAHLYASLRRVRALKRTCVPMTLDRPGQIDRWQTLAGPGRSARLAWCDALDGPALLGFRDPVIAWPRAHGARLTDDELDCVWLHELAHLRRRDDWVSFLEQICVGVTWINPVVHWMRHRAAVAREMCCDDWVVRQTASPVAYARCLTIVAGLRAGRRVSGLATSATGSRSVLGRRVTRVLGDGYRPGARLSRLLTLLPPVAVGLLAIAVIHMPPVLVETAPADVSHVVESSRQPVRAAAPVAGISRPSTSSGASSAGQPTVRLARPRSAAQPAATEASDRAADPSPGGLPGGVVAGQPTSDIVVGSREGTPPLLLAASAIAGLAPLGVIVADSAAVPALANMESRSLWDRTAAVGARAGKGATTAGRTTATFFRKLGSAVSRPFAR